MFTSDSLTTLVKHTHILCTECVINMITDLSQFYDGVVLVLLMGLLDNYYIPLSEYYTSPHGFDQQVNT